MQRIRRHFITGPFFPSLDRINAADFSRPFYSGYFTGVLPLETKSKSWYIIEPYQFDVWLVLIATIPIYLIALSMTDYLYSGVIYLDDLGGFIIRNVLSEQNFKPPNRAQVYQKLLDIIWIWSVFENSNFINLLNFQ